MCVVFDTARVIESFSVIKKMVIGKNDNFPNVENSIISKTRTDNKGPFYVDGHTCKFIIYQKYTIFNFNLKHFSSWNN